MNTKTTLSAIDFSKIKIDNLQYIPSPRSTNNRKVKHDEDVLTVDGHELNDQSARSQLLHQEFIKAELKIFQKFTGTADARQWFKGLLKKFDFLQINIDDRMKFVPDVLTGDALLWYIYNETSVTTFTSFGKLFLQHFTSTTIDDTKSIPKDHVLNQQQLITTNTTHDDVCGSLRNLLLLSHIEKLSKFTGRSKQNVSEWLREVNQGMDFLKLSDSEKLFYIYCCLEADAKDWFFDNNHLFSTWSSFVQKLLDTFESSGKADIAFNRLRQYQQGLNQDVRQYYFEIMKLCKEVNPTMDEASKLQYLKDGLKSSLRFDVLLTNPTTTEGFLEYAQKIEVLKSLAEQHELMEITSQQDYFNITSARPLNPPANYSNTSQINHNAIDASHNSSYQHCQSSVWEPVDCAPADYQSLHRQASDRQCSSTIMNQELETPIVANVSSSDHQAQSAYDKNLHSDRAGEQKSRISSKTTKQRNQNSSLRHRRNRSHFEIQRRTNLRTSIMRRMLHERNIPVMNVNILNSVLYIDLKCEQHQQLYNKLLPDDLFLRFRGGGRCQDRHL